MKVYLGDSLVGEIYSRDLWQSVEHLLAGWFGVNKVTVTCISRPDRRCDYHAPGEYSLSAVFYRGGATDEEDLDITLAE